MPCEIFHGQPPRRQRSVRHHDPDMPRPVLLGQGVERCSVARRQPHAAVGNRSPEAPGSVGSMHRIATVEEDGIGHRRVVVFPGIPAPFESFDREGACGVRYPGFPVDTLQTYLCAPSTDTLIRCWDNETFATTGPASAGNDNIRQSASPQPSRRMFIPTADSRFEEVTGHSNTNDSKSRDLGAALCRASRPVVGAARTDGLSRGESPHGCQPSRRQTSPPDLECRAWLP